MVDGTWMSFWKRLGGRRAPVVIFLVVVALGAGMFLRIRQGENSAVRPRPRSTASLTILEPQPGSLVAGSEVRIRLMLTGGRVVLETSSRLTPDEGHIHLTLDGKLISMTAGLAHEVLVSKGPHILQAEFVANDHLPFNPRVITTAPFVVR